MEGMPTMADFCQNKPTDKLKPRVASHNKANISLYSSASAKHCRFTEKDEELLSKD